MNDEQLALAALDILRPGAKPTEVSVGRHKWAKYSWNMDARAYVRDWRVAGPLMEKLQNSELMTLFEWQPKSHQADVRSIVLACVDAIQFPEKEKSWRVNM